MTRANDERSKGDAGLCPHPRRGSRATPLGLPLCAALVACAAAPAPPQADAPDPRAPFLGAPLAEQAASFAPHRGRRVAALSLDEFLRERTLPVIAGIDFHAGRTAGTAGVTLGAATPLTADGYLLTASHNAQRPPVYVLTPDPDGPTRLQAAAAHGGAPPRVVEAGALRLYLPSEGQAPPEAPLPLDVAGRSFLAHRARVVWGGGSTGGRMDVTLLSIRAHLPAHFERWAEHADVRAGVPVVCAGWPLPSDDVSAGPRLEGYASRVAAGVLLEAGLASPPASAITVIGYVHDAPLRVGYSGGPLTTLDGGLLGVNVSVRETPQGQRGVGLAPHPRWLASMIRRDRDS